MPIQVSKDNRGYFYRWGHSGKKYYFDEASKESKIIAYHKAASQGRAAHANGYQRK